MENYYQLLGIRKDASYSDIRSAYKKLAMLYHPDRNPGNRESEELFKLINEAYHVLSSPEKRIRYNQQFEQPSSTYHSSAHDEAAYWKDYHRVKYEQWRQSQQSIYQIDKNYFRVQAMAIGVFLVIAGFCFASIHLIKYIDNQEIAETRRQNLALVKQIQILFTNGEHEKALHQIHSLQEKEPLEYVFVYTEDSLITSLRTLATQEFDKQHFERALAHYYLLQQYEKPLRSATLLRMSECLYFAGRFEDAILTLKQLLQKQPGNIDLIYRIATIYQDHINNTEETLHYLTLAKKSFKESMTRQYGEAFEIVMDPHYVHDIYYDIFKRRADINIALKNFKEAETDCNWAILLRPSIGATYYTRAICKINNGNRSNACSDLKKSSALGYEVPKGLLKKYCYL